MIVLEEASTKHITKCMVFFIEFEDRSIGHAYRDKSAFGNSS